MVKQLTDEDYDWLGGRLSSAGDPGMQPISEEGLAALKTAPPEPSETELAEAAVAGYRPPEAGPVPAWAKEWGYLPQKPWDTSYYDIPVARLMDFPFDGKGGRVHTVHEGDYVENLGTVSQIRMDPAGVHVSVEIAPDDENTPPFWIGGDPGDPGAVVDRVDPRDLDLLLEVLERNRAAFERDRAAFERKMALPRDQIDADGRRLTGPRVIDEFRQGRDTQHLIYGTDDDGSLGAMAQADLTVMTGDADVASTTIHEIDGTEWTRHAISGRDGAHRVFYEDPETGRVVNASIPANAE